MISIIPAAPEHAPHMNQLEMESFSEAWSENSIKCEIMSPTTITYVAIDGGEQDTLVGHVYMRHLINEGHIINLAIKKSHRRRGIASMLIKKLIEVAHKREMIGLTLEVRESNRAAIALYQQHEFAEEGVRKNYYTRPTENGIIMWLYL
ncbi:MAG: ribosomal protein S18-alanine N-acetyltransferase [Defluviitaleaceae bacterium]|nr:ribosomal protein S18-alanine N-acetyltransferase [Defluviitaleaceae bacterium]